MPKHLFSIVPSFRIVHFHFRLTTFLLSLFLQSFNGSTFLNKMDLSNNQISGNILASHFDCLISLQTLNLAGNSITAVNENAFTANYDLISLDLSRNKIATIPKNFFRAQKFTKLKYLYMQNNLLTELDPWYFFLEKILVINLSFNKIARFTNYLNWTIYNELYFSSNFNASIHMNCHMIN